MDQLVANVNRLIVVRGQEHVSNAPDCKVIEGPNLNNFLADVAPSSGKCARDLQRHVSIWKTEPHRAPPHGAIRRRRGGAAARCGTGFSAAKPSRAQMQSSGPRGPRISTRSRPPAAESLRPL